MNDFDLTLSCQKDQSLMIKKDNDGIHVKLAGFNQKEFNLCHQHTVQQPILVQLMKRLMTYSHLNQELLNCFNNLIEGSPNEPILLTKKTCDVAKLYSIWQDCHA